MKRWTNFWPQSNCNLRSTASKMAQLVTAVTMEPWQRLPLSSLANPRSSIKTLSRWAWPLSVHRQWPWMPLCPTTTWHSQISRIKILSKAQTPTHSRKREHRCPQWWTQQSYTPPMVSTLRAIHHCLIECKQVLLRHRASPLDKLLMPWSRICQEK